MIASAEAHFRLDIPGEGGGTTRERTKAREEQRQWRIELGLAREGDDIPIDDNLDAQPPPRALQYLMEWFYDLNTDRQSNGFGPASITSGMILDWARGKGLRIRPQEFDALRRLNNAWLKIYAELNPPKQSA